MKDFWFELTEPPPPSDSNQIEWLQILLDQIYLLPPLPTSHQGAIVDNFSWRNVAIVYGT